MITVSIYGDGQLANGIADLLRTRKRHQVSGPFPRNRRVEALTSAADVVVVATTTRLRDVWEDVLLAVRSGSNVLVSAEESANPWLVDAQIADALDHEAKQAGVTILGAGLNPGLIFDALVLTLLGAAPDDVLIDVRRVVDISGFGNTVQRRLGIGFTAREFADRVREGEILGHAGFPQSIAVVGRALGRPVTRIEPEMLPVFAEQPIALADGSIVSPDLSSGVDQTYRAFDDGVCWYTARFLGHIALDQVGQFPRDTITLLRRGEPYQVIDVTPAFQPQIGSRHMLANSIDRVFSAAPGWLTVADLPPASLRY
jgi:hypothetical protein